jgi:eukaryotic-like serine/threonine-protein kinase
MKPIAILQFVAGEGPGYILEFLARRGRESRVVRIDESEPVPALGGMSGLVLMGGPMSVNDDLLWIPPVLELVSSAVAASVPVLGHCLGAQLMAKALGGEVGPNPCHEIGWGAVEVAESAVAKAWLGEEPEFVAFHWHGETFSLPVGASPILRSPHCENQAFAQGPHIGLQCHVEMTAAMVQAWGKSEAGAAEIAAHPGPAVQSAAEMCEDLESRVDALRVVADRVYGRWCGFSEGVIVGAQLEGDRMPDDINMAETLCSTDTLCMHDGTVSRHESVLSAGGQGEMDQGTTVAQDDMVGEGLVAAEEEHYRRLLERDDDAPKYVVRRRIAAGGMGAIYDAYDADMQRHSIVKVILPRHKQNADLITSFVREARITGQLEHPNIVPVHDIGFLEDYGIYFTMKYIRGECLVDVLDRIFMGDRAYMEKYDGFALLSMFRRVCDAVSFAHSQNVLHRDIKPHNIMVGEYGEVVLTDWGLAKKIGPQHTPEKGLNETRAGVVKGSPAYMSPEQAMGTSRAIDKNSDVFSLGATLYHIFTFAPPFQGLDVYDSLRRARENDYVDPAKVTTRNQGLPAELADVIRKALSPNKNERYDSAEALGRDVDDIMRGKMEFFSRVFEEGQYLVRDGETGRECYILLNGSVKVYKVHEGREVLLNTLNEGDIVGEMALITNEPRSANVVALERTSALVLTHDLFARNLEKLPRWMEKAVVALADRLREGNSRLAAE